MGFISDLLIEITSFRIRVGNKLNKLWGDIGNKDNLTTTDKSNLVNAVNEINQNDSNKVPYTGADQPVNLNNQSFISQKGIRVDNGHSDIFAVKSMLNSGQKKVIIKIENPTQSGVLMGDYNVHIFRYAGRSYTFNITMYKYNSLFYKPRVSLINGKSEDIVAVRFLHDGNGVLYLEFDFTTTANYVSVMLTNGNFVANYPDHNTKWTITNDIFFDTSTLILQIERFPSQFIRDSYLWNKGNLLQSSIDNWNTAFGWGNHASVGYAVSGTGTSQVRNNSQLDGRYLQLTGGTMGNNATIYWSGSDYMSGIIHKHRNVSSGGLAIGRMSTNTHDKGFGLSSTGDLIFGNWSDIASLSTSWNTVWHSGNFNPAQYVLQSALNTQLANYVPTNGVTTINNTKTFTSSPIVPNATLNGHAVNLGQLNTILGDYATEDWVNQQGFVTSDTTYSGSTSIILSGTSFQRAALTGDVTASQNSNTTTIANNAVTNPKMALMNANSIKGRAGSIGNPQDLTPAQVRTMLNVQEGANRTRIGINGGNYTEVGDINLIAGSNVSLSKSGENITISSSSSSVNTTVKAYMPGDVFNNDTIHCSAFRTLIYLSPSFTGPLHIAIEPDLQDGSELLVIHTYAGSGPGLFNIIGEFINHTGQLISTYPASQNKTYRFVYVKDFERFALVDVGQI